MAALAAVEDSHPDTYVSTHLKPTDPVELRAAPSAEGQGKPITERLCTAVRHLRARGGPCACFRGLSMSIVYCLIVSLVQQIGISLVRTRIEQPDWSFAKILIGLFAHCATANLNMARVHIVISEPSPKRFYQRIPGLKEWPKIVPVVVLGRLPIHALEALALNASLYHDADITTIMLGATFCLVGVLLDAVFVRVAASMLPEDHEAIVPFERSYGGKVVPAILGGSGKVSIVDAWRTFDWAGHIRFLKIQAPLFAIQMVLAIAIIVLTLVQWGYVTMAVPSIILLVRLDYII